MGPSHNLSFCACKTAWFAPALLVSMGPSPHLWVLHAKQQLLDQSTSLYGFQPSSVFLCIQNSTFRTRITSLCWVIDPTCGFCMQNSDFWARITSPCGSQTSPVIFCIQNSVPSIRNTSLHGSQPSRVVFGCKTATYGPQKQVSMGPRYDLSLCEYKTAWFASDLLVSMCANPHLCFF